MEYNNSDQNFNVKKCNSDESNVKKSVRKCYNLRTDFSKMDNNTLSDKVTLSDNNIHVLMQSAFITSTFAGVSYRCVTKSK